MDLIGFETLPGRCGTVALVAGDRPWRGVFVKLFPGCSGLSYDVSMTRPRFHLAFPVRDLAEARTFYADLLGCAEGRSSPDWIDFDFYGHQIVAHLSPDATLSNTSNPVDGENVPVRHFGVILAQAAWEDMARKLTAAGTEFIISPQTRFKGKPGEQSTLFFLDPSGNALEFKAFADDAMVFAK